MGRRKKIKLKLRCPECNKEVEHLITHHIIDHYFAMYLVNVCNIDLKEVRKLRRQLTVRLCERCEKDKHKDEIYRRAMKRFRAWKGNNIIHWNNPRK